MTDHTDLIKRLRVSQKLYEDYGVDGVEGALQAREAADALEAAEAEKAAAVAAVLDAAAKGAEYASDGSPPLNEWYAGYQEACDVISTQIRALATDEQTDALEAMLQAERKRCAQIADKQAWAHGGRYFDGPEKNSAAIARAIRAGGRKV